MLNDDIALEIIMSAVPDAVEEMSQKQLLDTIHQVLDGKTPNEISGQYVISGGAVAPFSIVQIVQDAATMAIAVKTTYDVLKYLAHDADIKILYKKITDIMGPIVTDRLRPAVEAVIEATIKAFSK